MSDLYSNDKVRIKAEQLVEREVIYCVSMLVSSIANGGEGVCEALGIVYEDDLLPLLESRDYDEPADNCIRNNWDEDELREYLDDQGVEYVAPEDETTDSDGNVLPAIEGTPKDELIKLAIAAMQEQGSEEFCNEQSIDPDYSEVYEHWIVSSWLARKLDEKGYTTGELCGLTIWGRPTTGQAISMDSVILEIANDILKEYPE